MYVPYMCGIQKMQEKIKMDKKNEKEKPKQEEKKKLPDNLFLITDPKTNPDEYIVRLVKHYLGETYNEKEGILVQWLPKGKEDTIDLEAIAKQFLIYAGRCACKITEDEKDVEILWEKNGKIEQKINKRVRIKQISAAR